MTYTDAQYRALGALIEMNCKPGNQNRVQVSKELGGNAMMVVIEYKTITNHSVTFGIEPDGYCHT